MSAEENWKYASRSFSRVHKRPLGEKNSLCVTVSSVVISSIPSHSPIGYQENIPIMYRTVSGIAKLISSLLCSSDKH